MDPARSWRGCRGRSSTPSSSWPQTRVACFVRWHRMRSGAWRASWQRIPNSRSPPEDQTSNGHRPMTNDHPVIRSWSLVIVWRVWIFAQPDDGGAPTAPLRRGVGEGLDERMPGQDRAHDRPLGARAAAVNDADLAKPAADALSEIFPDQVWDVPRREGVKIQG